MIKFDDERAKKELARFNTLMEQPNSTHDERMAILSPLYAYASNNLINDVRAAVQQSVERDENEL